jgi:nitroreductase
VDLIETLRTTASVREFRPEPVAPDVLARVLDTARFAPSGGNRQAWRVVVLQDPAVKAALRDLYLPGWYDYLAIRQHGLVPWAPVTDEAAERAALADAPGIAAAAAGSGGFAEHLAAVDRGFTRYTFAGGASVYPFVWNLLLAARAEGLAGVMTTMAIRREAEVKALLRVPDDVALAAVVALGRPVHQPTRLDRAPVASFTTRDRFDGPAFGTTP